MESSPPSDLNQYGAGPLAFDIDAYCARINYTSSRDASLATLKGLHFAHAHNVPFEILDIHLGKTISLDPAELFAKIVNRNRGGYCYEVNSFFAMILQAIGFQVQCLLARVLSSRWPMPLINSVRGTLAEDNSIPGLELAGLYFDLVEMGLAVRSGCRVA